MKKISSCELIRLHEIFMKVGIPFNMTINIKKNKILMMSRFIDSLDDTNLSALSKWTIREIPACKNHDDCWTCCFKYYVFKPSLDDSKKRSHTSCMLSKAVEMLNVVDCGGTIL